MNYEESKDKLKKLILARIPLIIFNTVEKERVLKMLKELNAEAQSSVFVHSMSSGMYDLNSGNKVSDEKTLMSILAFIAGDLQDKKNVTYLLNDVSGVNDDSVLTRFLCDTIQLAERQSSSIILVTDSNIWPNLRRLGMEIELSFPNEDEIYNLLKSFIGNYQNNITIEWDDNNYKEAATILLGLSEAEIKNTISILIASGQITKNDLVDLKFAKSELVSNMDGLEKIETDNITVGGLQTLQKWLASKKKLFDVNNKENLKKKGLRPPRGILVVGVPGCGKSLTAKAISKQWSMPLYLLDFASVQSKYVGESEEQLRCALKAAEHVSPCILWIDEIEKGLAGVNDSSGVTNRMIGQFLFWLQECKKEVFVIATANDVSKLPSELLRKGRFDEIFYVDLPNSNERKEIITLYFAKYLNIRVDDTFLNELVTITEGFASSDIEASIRDISYNVVSDNVQITKEYLLEYMKGCTSISKTNPEKVKYIQDWGKERAKNAS